MGFMVMAYIFFSGHLLGALPVSGKQYSNATKCFVYIPEEEDRFNELHRDKMPPGVSVVFRCESSKVQIENPALRPGL